MCGAAREERASDASVYEERTRIALRGPALSGRVNAAAGPRAGALVAGLALAGYGALVTLRVLAHESLAVGVLIMLAGAALAWAARPRAPASPPSPGAPRAPPGHSLAAAALGALAAGGVLAYNLRARSGLEPAEVAILAYGALLLAAAPHLHRRVAGASVGTVVAWSFPLVAAPLGLYALDAALDALEGSSPLDAFIRHGLVTPMAVTLAALGFEARAVDQTVMLATPRGWLALSVGVVCAGLHPSVLFLGVFGMHAWQERSPPRRLAALLALGLVGVYLANVVRLVALALVGYEWGGEALQRAHAHLGWLLFVAWMMLYWWLVLRRFSGAAPPPSAGA